MWTRIEFSLLVRATMLILSSLLIVLTDATFIIIENDASSDLATLQASLLSTKERESNSTDDVIESLPEARQAILNVTLDGYKQYDRIFIHVVMSVYCFWLLAIVCEEYFIASIHIFCHKLKINHELAAGTFMAMATSSPELCISCVSTFMNDGDIGIGAIVGSAIFNTLMATACCCFFARSVLEVDFRLLSRDCILYALTIIGLIIVIYDHLITWHEAVLMIVGYGIYLIVMFKCDMMMSEKMRLVAHKIKIRFLKVSLPYDDDFDKVTEITPLFMRKELLGNIKCIKVEKLSVQYDKFTRNNDCATNPWRICENSSLLLYLLRWPITFVLWCTIPDCRRNEKFFILTFINCVVWILVVSYLIASMITNVDSIMGMIFLGAGTSIPEVVSSVTATMQGNVDIGISNAISSNIFDILLCLGIPWATRTLLVPLISGKPCITLNATGITYSAVSLLATLLIFYLLFLINRFKLDKKIGVSCLIFYLAFIIFTLMLEIEPFYFPLIFPTATINGLI